ncbi:hypothetical protein [Alicyclobacillus mengziensis]|uniref:Uncharacterized protein n=1 Tax=Alicyclobacillus mengziensis TaxID=2931921 RepID=A0A9X7Z6K3_9BACL|nr:hypothetical protein [Alicyclobacillus mengziensis]QSO47477.1 hypothetical protein JZ786_24370 [Alicyclobacillus mengziensis]
MEGRKTKRTEMARGLIQEFLMKKGEGVKVRESDLFEEIKQIDPLITDGVLRGIANKMKGIGGYVPISNVEVVKEGSKSFYFYQGYKFSDGFVGSLQKKLIDFKNELKRDNLWDVSIIGLSSEERRVYLEFVDRFEHLMSMFSFDENE